MINVTHLSGNARDVLRYNRHERYYTGSPETLGYYQGEGSNGAGAPGFWHGRAAAALGLSGEVDGEEFRRLLEADGFGRQRHARRRLGTDVTASAPKSVSIAALALGDTRLIEEHEAAVRAMLDYIERTCMTTRRGKRGCEREATGNLVAAVYQHEDARPEDGVADCDLHSHAILANLTERADGTWRTTDLDFGPGNLRWYLADQVYLSRLSHGARNRCGYRIEQTEHGFELAGIDETIRDAFSRRSRAVDAELEARGTSREKASSRQRAAANHATRAEKTQLDRDQQHREWRARAADLGLRLVDLPTADPSGDGESGNVAYDSLADAVVAETMERTDVVSEAELLRSALHGRYGRLQYDDALAGIRDAHYTLVGVGGTSERDRQYTSVAAARREGWIIGRMQAGQGAMSPIMGRNAVSDYIAAREAREGRAYSPGQREAIQTALTSRDQVIGVRGVAGAGKTTAMRSVVAACQDAGYTVTALGPSHRATDELREAGADDTRTVSSYTLGEQEGDDDRAPRLIVLDESAMTGSRPMADVLDTLGDDDLLLLVGDPRQLQPVDAGHPFELLEQHGMTTAVIPEIQRQRDPEQRRVAELFAHGRSSQGAAAARQFMTTVAAAPGADQRETACNRQVAVARAAAERWLAMDPQTRDETIILSGTNRVRHEVNSAVRDTLRECGEVREELGRVTSLTRAGFSLHQTGQAGSYGAGRAALSEGQSLIAVIGDDRYVITGANKSRGYVTAVDDEGRTHTIAGRDLHGARVYTAEALPLAVGDRILVRDGDRDLGIRNGDTGRVVGGTRAGGIRIAIDTHREITLQPGQAIPMEYGYARTIHSAQGATVRRSIVCGEASRVATAEAAYVAMSRQQHDVEVYTNDPDRLVDRWSRQAARHHATGELDDPSGGVRINEVDHARLAQIRAAGEEEGRAAGPARIELREAMRYAVFELGM